MFTVRGFRLAVGLAALTSACTPPVARQAWCALHARAVVRATDGTPVAFYSIIRCGVHAKT